MTLNQAYHEKRLGHFSRSMFKSCKEVKEGTKIIVLSWKSLEDKKMISEVAKKLRKFDLIEYTIGFASIKLILTARGRSRVNKHNDWYD